MMLPFFDGDIGCNDPPIASSPRVKFREENFVNGQHFRVLDLAPVREVFRCLWKMNHKQRMFDFLDDP